MAEDGNLAILMELMAPPPGFVREVAEPHEPAGAVLFETTDTLTGPRGDEKRIRMHPVSSEPVSVRNSLLTGN